MNRGDYWAFEFRSKEINQDIILAYLSQFPFEAFEEHENYITGYLPCSQLSEDLEKAIEKAVPGTLSISKRRILLKNWNMEWESNFEPVEVGSFCRIRAPFHLTNTAFDIEIVIQPKMAFGTGHHETTHLMISKMADIDFNNANVLDFGCGTGILGIVADRLGAKQVSFVDIDPVAIENTKDNWDLNGCKADVEYSSTLQKVIDEKYDIILANVNLHVLLNKAFDFRDLTSASGSLLLSGILNSQRNEITRAYEEGWKLISKESMGDWICLHFQGG